MNEKSASAGGSLTVAGDIQLRVFRFSHAAGCIRTNAEMGKAFIRHGSISSSEIPVCIA